MSVRGTKPVATLGDYVRRLADGGRCFCCGASLRQVTPATGVRVADPSGTRLVCPHCGSEVSEGEPQADSDDGALQGDSMVRLTAA